MIFIERLSASLYFPIYLGISFRSTGCKLKAHLMFVPAAIGCQLLCCSHRCRTQRHHLNTRQIRQTRRPSKKGPTDQPVGIDQPGFQMSDRATQETFERLCVTKYGAQNAASKNDCKKKAFRGLCCTCGRGSGIGHYWSW